MSTFGWSPNDHRDELPQFSPNPDGVKPIQDTSLEEYVARFHQSQEHEDAMKDTEPTTTIEALTKDIATIDIAVDALIAKNAALTSENGLLRRSLSVLNNRIDELESTRNNVTSDAEALLERLEHIAAVLKTFYFAELSMSSVQPILALAIEFNPDIVEQRR
jgi:hypothetical protein